MVKNLLPSSKIYIDGRATSWGEFHADNREGLHESEIRSLESDLIRCGRCTWGGGAAAQVLITLETTTSRRL